MNIIIIGGGISGLVAGIYAQRNGLSAKILEKNDVVGGQCTGWNRNGYHIDNCIHWLTGTKKGTPLNYIWSNVGALNDEIDIYQPKLFYSSEYNNEKITLWIDLDKTKEELLALSPEDKLEIEKFIEYVKLAKKIKSNFDWAKILAEFGNINIADYANKFSHPLINQMIRDFMPSEYTAVSLFISYATISSGNGGIPKGGSKAMALRMQKRFEELGGETILNSYVSKIVIENNKAKGILTANGTFVAADYVICACDPYHVFNCLIDEKYMCDDMRDVYITRKNNAVFSGFQVAFSVDKDKVDILGSNIFDCEEIEIGTRKFSRMGVSEYSYESAYAPKGKTIIQCNFVQYESDYCYWKEIRNCYNKYIDEKNRIAQEILHRIVNKYPNLADNIKVLDVWTPMTYERYCNSYKGSYMGFIPTKNIEPKSFDERIKGIDNIILASQWLNGSGGLPIAAYSGIKAINSLKTK